MDCVMHWSRYLMLQAIERTLNYSDETPQKLISCNGRILKLQYLKLNYVFTRLTAMAQRSSVATFVPQTTVAIPARTGDRTPIGKRRRRIEQMNGGKGKRGRRKERE